MPSEKRQKINSDGALVRLQGVQRAQEVTPASIAPARGVILKRPKKLGVMFDPSPARQ